MLVNPLNNMFLKCFASVNLSIDPGARERARPYLRQFAVADPKLAICQARLKRSASAPNHPGSHAHTDQLRRKGIRKKEEKTMHKGNSTSSDDIRSLGRMSLIGLEQGVDGIFTRRKEDIVEIVITNFPVDNNSPSSKTDKLTRPESYKRKSFPDNGSNGSRTSQESSPKSCINCGQPLDCSKDVECNASADSAHASNYLTCRKCGHVRNYSSGGSSLPGTPYSAHRTLETSPFGLPSQRTVQSPTKANGNINNKHVQMHGDGDHHLLKSKEPSDETKAVLNGGIKTEHVSKKPFEGLPPDSFGRQFGDLLYESPSSKAQRLFNFEGFDRDEVAQELSKK